MLKNLRLFFLAVPCKLQGLSAPSQDLNPCLAVKTLVLTTGVCVCSVMSGSFLTPWTGSHQTPLTIEFSRQEYWSGLPFPPAGDLPNPGVNPMSPSLAGKYLTTEPPGKPGQGIPKPLFNQLIVILF